MIMPDHENMPRYSFDNFLVGKSNEFAHVLAKTVAERPDSYNPLFIYGDLPLNCGRINLLCILTVMSLFVTLFVP